MRNTEIRIVEVENMKQFIITIAVAFFGLMIGLALNLEGWLGTIFTIAIVGVFIVEAIEKKK